MKTCAFNSSYSLSLGHRHFFRGRGPSKNHCGTAKIIESKLSGKESSNIIPRLHRGVVKCIPPQAFNGSSRSLTCQTLPIFTVLLSQIQYYIIYRQTHTDRMHMNASLLSLDRCLTLDLHSFGVKPPSIKHDVMSLPRVATATLNCPLPTPPRTF